MAAGGPVIGSSGSMRCMSTRVYRGEAEYHSLRSPGGSSATRWRGSSPAWIFAAAKAVRLESASYSGPSWATSSGSGSPGSASAGLQSTISRPPPKPRPGVVRVLRVPSTCGAVSHAGSS